MRVEKESKLRTEISTSELEAEVRAVAAEHPDFVYEMPLIDGVNNGCVYFDEDGSPSCLIGQGLARLGFNAEDFSHDGNNGMAIDDLLSHWNLASLSESRWLSDVQMIQDDGENWSYAVRAADDQRAKRVKAA